MNIVRCRRAGDGQPFVGVCIDDQIAALEGVESLAQLWTLHVEDLRELVTDRANEGSIPLADVGVLAPVDGHTEVWACGVTYEASREARIEESERAADVYQLVYNADRPEIFFKSVAWRVAGPGQPVGIRSDSKVNVPEPELALIINRYGEIAGFTICNDMSSRSIEAENPLYLPQAKIYSGSCSLGPWVRPAWEIDDPYKLNISLTINRGGDPHWQGRASTSQLRRRFDELIGYLLRSDVHPDGVVLSTGTCLVPPSPFTLAPKDEVIISIDGIGTLSNPVIRGAMGQVALRGRASSPRSSDS